jgi:hypothetical protein
MLEKIEKLAAANINLLPAYELTTHFVFERNGYVALVERRGEQFGGIGAAGLLTESGVAPLVWRGDQAFFVNRGSERRAEPEQIEDLRRFQADLKEALQ